MLKRSLPLLLTALTVALGGLLAHTTAQAQDGAPLWSRGVGSWVHDLDVTPWGDVASLTQSSLTVHDAATGERLVSIPVCGGERGRLHFVAPQRAVIVCDKEVRRIDFPDATSVQVLSLQATGEPTASASAGGTLAVGFADGSVRLFAADAEDGAWSERGSVQLQGKVSDLALSPDGATVAVGFDAGGLSLWEPASGKQRQLGSGRSRTRALSFSADGATLFATTDTFKAGFFATRTGKQLRSVRTGSWLNASAFVGQDVVASGSDGLVRYTQRAGTPTPINQLGERVTSDPAGGRFCAGDSSGNVECFGAAPPSRYADLARLGPEPPKAATVDTAPTSSATEPDPFATASPSDEPPVEREPSSPVLWDTVMTVYAIGALVGSPAATLAIHDDLSLDEATLISLVALGGSTTLALGGAMVGAGAVAVVLSALFGIFFPDDALETAGAGVLLMGVGTGLVFLSPVIFGVGASITDAAIGTEPNNPITISIVSTLAGAAGAGLGILWMSALDEDEFSTWAGVLAVVATSTFCSTVTYAAMREYTGSHPATAIIIPPVAIPF